MTMPAELHPALPLLAAALLMLCVGRGARRLLALAAPALSLVLTVAAPDGPGIAVRMFDNDWVLWRMDALSRLFALAFAGYGLIAGVYAWDETARGPKAASMALVGGGVGIVLAGDLMTLFFFWELLTVASLATIWFGGGRRAARAGFHYVLVHLMGGVCLLAGIVVAAHDGLGGEPMGTDHPAGWLMLIGMLINAAAPPLHAWLPDAYPRATIVGTVYLSAFTTKSAVYALARYFPGTELLIWVGAGMTLYGVFFAFLENNIRRLLSYHIVSQVGFMVCGVGLGTDLGLNGATAHAFSHIFYKGLLLMAAGAVVHATSRERLSELGGLAASLRPVMILYLIGALSISGAPPFNGFVSKSMTISAAAEAHRPIIESMLLVASVGTFLSVGLKLPYFAFFGPERTVGASRRVATSMHVGMILAAAVCVITGFWPWLLYRLLPTPVAYHPYTAHHVLVVVQLLAATGLGFELMRAKLTVAPTRTLDVDCLYRRPLTIVIEAAGVALQRAGEAGHFATTWALEGAWRLLRTERAKFRFESLAPLVAVVCGMLGLLAWLLLGNIG